MFKETGPVHHTIKLQENVSVSEIENKAIEVNLRCFC